MEAKMNNLNLPLILQNMDTFVKERDWDQFHTVKNLAMALSVESSELVEIFQWLTEKQSMEARNDPKLKGKVEDEVADVFFYLLRIVSKMDIDLEQAVLAKMKKNAEKYPVEKSKGSVKKYTEL